MNDRVSIPGSAPKLESGETVTPLTGYSQEQVTVTIVLRRSPEAQEQDVSQKLLAGEPLGISAEQATEADPKDIAAVRSFVQSQGLTIVQENPASRTIKVSGAVEQMNHAFAVQLGQTTDRTGEKFLAHAGEISVPESLQGIIIAVLGLDQRPAAQHHDSGV